MKRSISAIVCLLLVLVLLLPSSMPNASALDWPDVKQSAGVGGGAAIGAGLGFAASAHTISIGSTVAAGTASEVIGGASIVGYGTCLGSTLAATGIGAIIGLAVVGGVIYITEEGAAADMRDANAKNLASYFQSHVRDANVLAEDEADNMFAMFPYFEYKVQLAAEKVWYQKNTSGDLADGYDRNLIFNEANLWGEMLQGEYLAKGWMEEYLDVMRAGVQNNFTDDLEEMTWGVIADDYVAEAGAGSERRTWIGWELPNSGTPYDSGVSVPMTGIVENSTLVFVCTAGDGHTGIEFRDSDGETLYELPWLNAETGDVKLVTPSDFGISTGEYGICTDDGVLLGGPTVQMYGMWSSPDYLEWGAPERTSRPAVISTNGFGGSTTCDFISQVGDLGEYYWDGAGGVNGWHETSNTSVYPAFYISNGNLINGILSYNAEARMQYMAPLFSSDGETYSSGFEDLMTWTCILADWTDAYGEARWNQMNATNGSIGGGPQIPPVIPDPDPTRTRNLDWQELFVLYWAWMNAWMCGIGVYDLMDVTISPNSFGLICRGTITDGQGIPQYGENGKAIFTPFNQLTNTSIHSDPAGYTNQWVGIGFALVWGENDTISDALNYSEDQGYSNTTASADGNITIKNVGAGTPRYIKLIPGTKLIIYEMLLNGNRVSTVYLNVSDFQHYLPNPVTPPVVHGDDITDKTFAELLAEYWYYILAIMAAVILLIAFGIRKLDKKTRHNLYGIAVVMLIIAGLGYVGDEIFGVSNLLNISWYAWLAVAALLVPVIMWWTDKANLKYGLMVSAALLIVAAVAYAAYAVSGAIASWNPMNWWPFFLSSVLTGGG